MEEAERDWGGGGRKRRRRERRKTKAMDTVVVNTTVMEPDAPLANDPGSEHHCPLTSMLGGNGGQVYIERVIYKGHWI